jgi:hypothetical protein
MRALVFKIVPEKIFSVIAAPRGLVFDFYVTKEFPFAERALTGR